MHTWWWILWVLNMARLWLGSLQGKVKSPSSSTSGGDSPVEAGTLTPLSTTQIGESSIIDECSSSAASSVSHQLPQDKPQRPFSLKVWHPSCWRTRRNKLCCRWKALISWRLRFYDQNSFENTILRSFTLFIHDSLLSLWMASNCLSNV